MARWFLTVLPPCQENATLQRTMVEAEKAIDELVAVVDKEKTESSKHQKSFADMKSYADELETAFNGLHGRYTKLKEYYTASDANQQARTLLSTFSELAASRIQGAWPAGAASLQPAL